MKSLDAASYDDAEGLASSEGLDGYSAMAVDREQRGNLVEEIYRVDVSAFGRELSASWDFFNEALENAEAVWIVLKDTQGQIIGYSYAVPSGKDKQAFIPRTGIVKEFQGRGLVKLLNNVMDEELLNMGYELGSTLAEKTNGYAASLLLVYAEEGRLISHQPLGRDVLNGRQQEEIVYRLGA
jgi:hypothetical protein